MTLPPLQCGETEAFYRIFGPMELSAAIRSNSRRRACQPMLNTQGLGPDTLAQGAPLMATMPTTAVRQAFRAALEVPRATAQPLGLAHGGVPLSSDPSAARFGVAKPHGVGQTQEAARSALRWPALGGAPTREEAEQVLGSSVARPQERSAQGPSLTTQRRAVCGHPEQLERLGLRQGTPHVERIPSPKNRANHAAAVNRASGCGNRYGPPLGRQETPCVMENVGPPDMREAVVTCGVQKPVNGSRPI